MNELVLSQYGSIDFRHLNESELDVVVQVIQKDFELKASEKSRLRMYRRKLKEADERVSILINSDFNESFCVICFKRFVALFHPKQCCLSCWHCMCPDCSIWVSRDKMYICLLCQNERTIKSMACEWYYNLLKDRFEHDASELVAQSLYSNRSQYSLKLLEPLTHPDLLEKVKGAQISRYRQKIQCAWDEMQERLRRLDLSELNEGKREESNRFIYGEYRTKFRDILKEFSQVLYITLENYATRTEGVFMNINEQVLETVHGVVESLIGYSINILPDEIQSVVSDVESTASMFMGNDLEEKLAIALITKIHEDNRKVYSSNNVDLNFLDNFQIRSDDQSSTTTYLYRASHASVQGVTRANDSRGSSLVPSTTSTYHKTIPAETTSNKSNSSFSDSNRSSFNEYEDMSEVVLSAKKVQQMLKSTNSSRSSLVDRQVNIHLGEPINLSVQLNGIRKTEIIWNKACGGRKNVLKNDAEMEIIASNKKYGTVSNLRISSSKKSDDGRYIAYTSNCPIASFVVKVIDDDHTPSKPAFRLKMMNCSVRTGQNGEFSVETTGHPKPSLVFYHNNTILNIPSPKYDLEHVPNISRVILTINKVVVSDRGVYKCTASSESGSCECTAELQVTSLNFRFEKRDSIQSNSSVDEDVYIPQVRMHPDFADGPPVSAISVNQSERKGQTLSSNRIEVDPSFESSESETSEMEYHRPTMIDKDNPMSKNGDHVLACLSPSLPIDDDVKVGPIVHYTWKTDMEPRSKALGTKETKPSDNSPLIVKVNVKVKVGPNASSMLEGDNMQRNSLDTKSNKDDSQLSEGGDEISSKFNDDHRINGAPFPNEIRLQTSGVSLDEASRPDMHKSSNIEDEQPLETDDKRASKVGGDPIPTINDDHTFNIPKETSNIGSNSRIPKSSNIEAHQEIEVVEKKTFRFNDESSSDANGDDTSNDSFSQRSKVSTNEKNEPSAIGEDGTPESKDNKTLSNNCETESDSLRGKTAIEISNGEPVGFDHESSRCTVNNPLNGVIDRTPEFASDITNEATAGEHVEGESIGDQTPNERIRKDPVTIEVQRRPDIIEKSPTIPPRKPKIFGSLQRIEAIEAHRFSPKITNSKSMDSIPSLSTWTPEHFTRLRDMFNQGSMQAPTMRRESITKRTPPIIKENPEIRLTKEVRVRNVHSMNDHKI